MFVRVMFWKEIREHRLQAMLLVGMAAGVLVLLEALSPDISIHTFRATLSASFAWACGMVTGAILLANESESMTQIFLDQLPRTRRQVWWSKTAFGLFLTLVEAGILSAVCLTLRQGGELDEPPAQIMLMNLLGGLFGLSCGLFGSSLSGNVLSAIGWSVVALFGSLLYGMLCFALLGALARGLQINDRAEPGLTFLAFLFSLPMPMVLSSWLYTSLDRQRGVTSRFRLLPRFGFDSGRSGLRQILWLSFRQGWSLQLFLCIVVLIGSVFMVVEPFAAWPMTTLLLGLLAGVGVVGDEQYQGSFRFLAEQRLPLNRFWLIKVASRLTISIGLAVAMLFLAGLGREVAREISGHNLNANWEQEQWAQWVRKIGPVNFLAAFLAYGFAFGHLIGLFARKTFVAFAVGLAASLTFLSLWFPSMIDGGLPAWQVLAIPIGLLAIVRLSLWKWATDRLYTQRSLVVCSAFAIAGIGFVGLSLANRVWETPKATAPFNVLEFELAYPKRPENEVRSKLIQADELFRNQQLNNPQIFGGRNARFSGIQRPTTQRDLLAITISSGWPTNDSELASAVQTMGGGGWLPVLRDVAGLSPTVVDDPRDLAISSLVIADRLREMVPWIAARALQIQSQGDHEGAFNLISVLLSLARHVENRATFRSYVAGWQIGYSTLQTLEQWSRNPKVPPELLERALRLTRDHETRIPPFSDSIKAEYLLQRDVLAERMNPYRGQNSSSHRDWQQLIMVPANVAPWENARRERLFNACFELMMQTAATDYPTLLDRARSTQFDDEGNPRRAWMLRTLPVTKDDAGETLKRSLATLLENDLLLEFVSLMHRSAESVRFRQMCEIRGAEIRLALLVYQRRHGKPAESLEQLTPDLLPIVPIDPYSERPFNYRLANQEEWIPWRKQVLPGTEDWGVEVSPASSMMMGAPGGPQLQLVPSLKFRPVTSADESATYRRLKLGYGVIWSVGGDGTNDGGKQHSESTDHPVNFVRGGRAPGFDILFVVPSLK